MVLDNKQKHRFSRTLDVWISNLSKTGRSRKQAVTMAVDSTIVAFSLWAAYSLRHGMLFSDFRSTWHLFLVLPVATILIFMSLGIYRWVVRSSNSKLFKQLSKAVIAASVFLVLFAFIFPTDNRIMPRSLFLIYGLLLGTGTVGARFIWKGIFHSQDKGEPVAIYGAGSAGQQLLHSLSQGSDFRPVLFLDDNKLLEGSTIAGLPVVTTDSTDLESALIGLEVERVILAMPKLGPKEYQEKLPKFKAIGVPVLTVPSHADIMSGRATVGQVRDISIADILGRSEVPANPALLAKCVSGKCVLVTGGGGSIGSELSRQILSQNPEKLIVFDQSEFNLYKITEELNAALLKMKGTTPIFKPMLGSVCDQAAIQRLMVAEGVNTVYHAAAYKHVPVIESQPDQGLQTNVFGTLKVLDAASASGVENFVLISTDKAVRPTNAMGATKRIAELVLQAKARQQTSTKICMVRFGNVLGSSGSVVPKFMKQIEQGGPITLTDPNITRYFMTIPEAAQLVMQASAIAKGGDVFVLDMGEPVRIEDLAKTMVRLSGRKLKRDTGLSTDIEIIVEGLRPGEKMYEELFLSDSHEPTKVQKIFSAHEYWMEWDILKRHLDDISRSYVEEPPKALTAKLLELAFSGLNKEQKATPKKSLEKEAFAERSTDRELISVEV